MPKVVCLLRVAEPHQLERVYDFFRRVHVAVRIQEDGTIRASIPGALTPSHGRRVIAGYVATWNALNPASPLEMVTPT
jgi:hypothetical protein